MLACVDVDYQQDHAKAACCLFEDYDDAAARSELVEVISEPAAYRPGQFYLRELPCLLAVLKRVSEPLAAILIDGYVWLDEAESPGLGAHLYRALEERVPIIGVAKSRYRHPVAARAVLRGDSQRPLYVSAAGADLDEAANAVARMHGEYRIPTLLKRVDRLCRGRR